MKRVLLTIIIIFIALLRIDAQSIIINSNCRRIFNIETVHIDHNQDYKAQPSEVYDFSDEKETAKFYFNYKIDNNKTEFYFKIIINKKGKKQQVLSNTLEDIILIKGDNRYTIGNKLDELQLGLVKEDDENWTLFISNPAILMK